MKFKIKEKQIKAMKDILREGNGHSAHYIKIKLKKLFPEVFEEKYVKSISGNWYFNGNGKTLFRENDQKNNRYGFNSDGCWSEGIGDAMDDTLTQATTEEVTKALTKEAIKKGFVDGARYNSLPHSFYNTENNTKVDMYRYDNNLNVLFSRLGIMFDNGKWAEIIPQVKEMTVAEISKELGYEIKIVK